MIKTVNRTCIVTREILNKKDLLRLVLNKKTGLVEFDFEFNKPGRGCYIKADKDILEKAFKIKAIERALKIQSISEGNKDLLITDYSSRRPEDLEKI